MSALQVAVVLPLWGGVGLAVLGAGAATLVVWLVERSRRQRGRQTVEEMLTEAREKAERLQKEAQISIKEEIYRRREEFQKELREGRQEIRGAEKRLTKREDSLDHTVDILTKKEKYIEKLERNLATKRRELNEEQAELERVMEQEKINLHKISGLSRSDAESMLLKRLESEMTRECAQLVSRHVEKAREEAERQARKILAGAIQRYAAEHTAENVVAAIPLPSDDMKGRIIGREGRNIRAFEKATGMDVVVDDTPGVVVVSGFDGIRREIGRRAMQALVQDGRIHPGRIEQVVEQCREEMAQTIVDSGKQAALDANVHNLDPRIIELLGRLQYRTSYGQNQLQHSLEVAHLAGTIASELNLDPQLARRCGLLHDIGKAIDHDVEGSHPEIGADVAKRCGESPEVIDAIRNHHEDTNPETIYTVLIAAADAVSASRPGARRETLEKYIKRLERLEEIAGAFPGVDQAYAIQAGREVRVIVNAGKVDDKMTTRICRDIAKEIEEEMTYPGEVKVTVIRETRVVELAR